MGGTGEAAATAGVRAGASAGGASGSASASESVSGGVSAGGGLDRVIGRLGRWVGDESPALSRVRFDALRRFVVLGVAVEAWNGLRYRAYQDDLVLHTAVAVVQLACLAGAWSGRFTRVAAGVCAAGLASSVALAFPFNANHQLVQGLLLLCIVLARPDADADRRDALCAARWVAVAVMFWAGTQKLLWGHYLGGEFLAWRVAVDPGFAEVFRFVMPDAEWQRLVALESAPGAGPYRVDSLLFVVVSNLGWLAEWAVAGGLLVGRLRPLAWPAGIAFIVGVELAAREIFFGGLIVFLLLLFDERRAAPRSLYLFVPVYAYLFAMAVGWLPHWSFG
ncbi:MAG: hypothetical protein ACQGVK_18790 [Myxococcota bacterium]